MHKRKWIPGSVKLLHRPRLLRIVELRIKFGVCFDGRGMHFGSARLKLLFGFRFLNVMVSAYLFTLGCRETFRFAGDLPVTVGLDQELIAQSFGIRSRSNV